MNTNWRNELIEAIAKQAKSSYPEAIKNSCKRLGDMDLVAVAQQVGVNTDEILKKVA